MDGRSDGPDLWERVYCDVIPVALNIYYHYAVPVDVIDPRAGSAQKLPEGLDILRITALGASWSLVSGSASRVALLLLCLLGSACASGGGTSTGAGPAVVLPRNSGFDGGTQVTGGFTNVVSAVRDSVVAETRGTVWAVMPDVFETLGIETPTVEPRSFVIGNPGSRVSRIAGSLRLSTYLDCGIGILGPNADRQEVTLQIMVQLAGYPGGGTLVRTTLDAYARPRDTAGEPIHCASQGTLERQIVDLIASELSGEADRSLAYAGVLGRVPVAGDLLRVECLAPQAQTRSVGEGLFLGAGNGDLLLGVGTGGGSVAVVPVVNVGRVQVRERRSASKMAGVVVAVLGMVGGGIQGRSWYDPEGDTHYPQGVFMAAGVLGGGIAGAILGRITGSFIGTDAWVDAPRDWAGRYSSAVPAESAAGVTACASFDAGG
jgi:hypothetical protein